MVNFLIQNNEDIQQVFIDRNRNQERVVQLPFDQEKKRKIVVRKVPDDNTQVRVFVKGAPEYVIPLCDETFDSQMSRRELDNDEQVAILKDVCSDGMAKHGLKTLSYAYKQIPLDELNHLMEELHIESEEFRNELETELIYLATFGLEDPIRDGIAKSVQLIRYGTVLDESIDRSKGAKNQVNIRMITGDHIDTALHVATRSGVITEEEQGCEGLFMTGEQFRKAIGSYERVWSEKDKKYVIQFEEMARFKAVKARLRIIARASAEDKLLLISGIKQAGGLVAMSGESIADAMALKEADVGLCMGSGCQVAKDSSDLVILDNDFASIHRSIKWGRAIFDNVRKFIQFQLTINISLCSIVLITGATLGQSPFKVIHLLWANLVMDILGAIAIGTEPPKKEEVITDGA